MNLDGLRTKHAFAAILLALVIAVLPSAGARCAPGRSRENSHFAFERASCEVISLRAGETKSVGRKGLEAVTIQLICGPSDSVIPDLEEQGSPIVPRDSAETEWLLIDFRGRAPPAA